MRIAFLGTGRMGTELALRLLEPHPDMVVWNRTREHTTRLTAAGADLAATPSEAVQGADVVVTSLFGPDTVREVVTGPGLIPAGLLWLDSTTVAPSDAAEFAAAVPSYVATPVVGTLGPARAGRLGVYVGTSQDDLRSRAADLVKPWADPERLKPVDSAPKAAAGKLLANLALAVSAQGLREALTLGGVLGVSKKETLTMLDGTGLAFIAGMKGPFVRGERDVEQGEFTVDAIAKDARLMLDAVDHAGGRAPEADLPALRAALASLEHQQERGQGSSDFSVILRPDG